MPGAVVRLVCLAGAQVLLSLPRLASSSRNAPRAANGESGSMPPRRGGAAVCTSALRRSSSRRSSRRGGDRPADCRDGAGSRRGHARDLALATILAVRALSSARSCGSRARAPARPGGSVARRCSRGASVWAGVTPAVARCGCRAAGCAGRVLDGARRAGAAAAARHPRISAQRLQPRHLGARRPSRLRPAPHPPRGCYRSGSRRLGAGAASAAGASQLAGHGAGARLARAPPLRT